MAAGFGQPTADITADMMQWSFVGIILVVAFLAMFIGFLPIIGTIIGIVVCIAAKFLKNISDKTRVMLYVFGAVVFAVSIAALILLGAAAASVPELPAGVNSVSELYGLSDSIALRAISIPMRVFEGVANPLLNIGEGQTLQSAGVVTFEQTATTGFGAAAGAGTGVPAAPSAFVGF